MSINKYYRAFILFSIFCLLCKCAPYVFNNFISRESLPSRIPALNLNIDFSVYDWSNINREIIRIIEEGVVNPPMMLTGKGGELFAFDEDTKFSKFDNRKGDAISIITGEFLDNIFVTKNTDSKKYGTAECKIIYSGAKSLKPFMYVALPAITLSGWWLLGLPSGEQTANVTVIVTLCDNNKSRISKYESQGSAKVYAALYWGYSVAGATYVADHVALTRAALSTAIKNAFAEIKLKIQNDSKMIAEKLMSSENVQTTLKMYEPPEINWIFVKGDTFDLGDVNGDGGSNEKPVHTVVLSDFNLSNTEVTVAQFRKYCTITGAIMPSAPPWGWHLLIKKGELLWQEMPSAPPWGWHDNDPIVSVTLFEAVNFCHWLGCRLPTEAEWEFAARERGKKIKWAGTNNENELSDYAWFETNSNNQAHPVASKKPNELGLFDMNGNVFEWCADWYKKKYESTKVVINPRGPAEGTERVVRGGAYNSLPDGMRSSYRLRKKPSERYTDTGFRVARTVK